MGKANYHHGDLRAALIEAARRVTAEKGADQVSVAEVARRAGVSGGAPYRHFADRRALMTAVAVEAARSLTAALITAVAEAGSEPVDRVTAAGRVYVTTLIRDRAGIDVIFSADLAQGSPDPGSADPGFAEPGSANPGFAEPGSADHGSAAQGSADLTQGSGDPCSAERAPGGESVLSGAGRDLMDALIPLVLAVRPDFKTALRLLDQILAVCHGYAALYLSGFLNRSPDALTEIADRTADAVSTLIASAG